jgi:hypothetical protein
MQICPLHGATSITYKKRGNFLVETGLFKTSPVECGTSILDANINVIDVTNFFLIHLSV